MKKTWHLEFKAPNSVLTWTLLAAVSTWASHKARITKPVFSTVKWRQQYVDLRIVRIKYNNIFESAAN